MTREQEIIASKYFGKHVTGGKALVTFIAAVLLAAAPIIIGVRFWSFIPETVITGITDMQGKDDSMPRAVLVFGVPLLFVILTVICHAQLWLHQKLNRLPKTPIRLLGRWVMPVISVFACCRMQLSAAGQSFDLPFAAELAVGVILILLGSRAFDARLNAAEYKRRSGDRQALVSRSVGSALIAAGFIIILPLMLGVTSLLINFIAGIVAVMPFIVFSILKIKVSLI